MASKKSDSFKVAVRVRPPIQKEVQAKSAQCVEVDEGQRAVVIRKPETRRRYSQSAIDGLGVGRPTVSQQNNFFFDTVFGPSSTQDDIFAECVEGIVDSVLNGYNGSVIASGQTGSGKTYTIEGLTGSAKGIIPRATEHIFQYIESCPSKTDRFLVRTSFLEIYNERISDLMDSSRDNLRVREDGVGGVFVEGLSERVVRNTDEIIALLNEGSQLRSTAVTRMNKESSRSHAVFTIVVEHAEYDDSGASTVTIGKLRMVDLAGSERLDTEAQIRQQEETKNINVSLHTFSKVVSALTTPSVKYIPYRDSKLTRLLQDCLGGNCKTVLVATLAPLSSCYTESFNTLNFAKRAKTIQNTAYVNKDMSQKALLSAYEKEIRQLKRQLDERSLVVGQEELEKLERERIEAQKEKDAVLSQLKVQQKITSEAHAERDHLLSKISNLEETLLSGHQSKHVSETDEFKKALEIEQSKIREQTESELAKKLKELDEEKRRLLVEKANIEKQKEQMKARKYSNQEGMERAQLHVSSFPKAPRRIASADVLSKPVQKGWMNSAAYNSPSMSPGLQPTMELDVDSASALSQYVLALAHPSTGIPCQTLVSGIRIFTGSAAVEWFMGNMVGVSTLQSAQGVGQRLMDLNVFTEIQGGKVFLVSDSVYYQFCDLGFGFSHPPLDASLSRPQSSPHIGPLAGSSQPNLTRSYHPLASASEQSSTWGMSALSLNQSTPSLEVSGDLLEHFGLAPYKPSQMHVAALYGDINILRNAAKHFDINMMDADGQSALMYAVIGRQAKCCVQLIKLGADVNIISKSSKTALIMAVLAGFEEIVKLLMKYGADITTVNNDGKTVFHLAASGPNHKCLLYLCKHPSALLCINERDHQYHTPLHDAVMANEPGQVKRLLVYKADLGISDDDGRTALHYTVTYKSLQCTQAIVASVPNDVNLVDTAGQGALHVACYEGQLDIAQYLCSYSSCDVNLKDQLGLTPLHLAVQRNHLPVVSVLLEHGATDHLKDSKGKTALYYAIQMGHTECAEVIKNFSTKS